MINKTFIVKYLFSASATLYEFINNLIVWKKNFIEAELIIKTKR